MNKRMKRSTGALAGAVVLGVAVLAPAAAGAAEHVVRIISDYQNVRMYFKPKLLHIQPGDTVVWVNEVAEEHNVITYPDGYPRGAEAIVSPYLKDKDERWSVTLTVPGTYQYHCIPHLPMGMNGSIVVGKPSSEADFHEPSKAEVAAYRDQLLEYFDKDEFDYKPRQQRASK